MKPPAGDYSLGTVNAKFLDHTILTMGSVLGFPATHPFLFVGLVLFVRAATVPSVIPSPLHVSQQCRPSLRRGAWLLARQRGNALVTWQLAV